MASPFGAEWVSARAAREFAYKAGRLNPVNAGPAIIGYCRVGHIEAQALRVEWSNRDRYGENDRTVRDNAEVPQWFWEACAERGSSVQDWQSGIFSGKGTFSGQFVSAKLTGVYFRRDSLAIFEDQFAEARANPTVVSTKGGRTPLPWWDDLWIDIARKLYAGDLKPTAQSDLIRAMHDYAVAKGHDVGDTAIRDRARKLWQALQRDDEN